MPGQVLRYEVAAMTAEQELVPEIPEALGLVRLLDQPPLRDLEIVEEQREGGEHGARLEEQILHGALFRRVQVIDLGEFLDERTVGERYAGT